MADHDVVIVGAGPAGLAAGIYTARYGLKTLIIEKGLVGGTVTLASSIPNYPGFEDIGGMELMQKFQSHAEKAGAKLDYDAVEVINPKGKEIEIALQGRSITAKAVIVAVGAKSRWLRVAGEKEFLNKGVHFCATCDGPLYKESEVAVIGYNNRAADEAIYLATVTKKVYLISSKKEIMVDSVREKNLADKKVEIIHGANVTSFKGSTKLEEVHLKMLDGTEKVLPLAGAFVYIGTDPSTDFVDVAKDAEGRIIVNEKMETNVPGIFAAGDCIKKELFQIATCVGEGATAALGVSRYLNSNVSND